MGLEQHGEVSSWGEYVTSYLDSLRIAACKTGSFVLPPSSFVSIYCMAKAFWKGPTTGGMLTSNTEFWHLVTSRLHWVHGQRLCNVLLFASSRGKRAVQFDLIRWAGFDSEKR